MIKTLTLCMLLAGATPVLAQTAPSAPETQVDEGLDLLGEGAWRLFQGLRGQLEPALDDLGRQLSEMKPMFERMIALAGDLRHYQAPERLENGDILLRRKPDAPPPPPLDTPPAEIEL